MHNEVGLEEQRLFGGRCIVVVRGGELDVVLLLWLCEICILLDLRCRFWCNMLGDNNWFKRSLFVDLEVCDAILCEF